MLAQETTDDAGPRRSPSSGTAHAPRLGRGGLRARRWPDRRDRADARRPARGRHRRLHLEAAAPRPRPARAPRPSNACSTLVPRGPARRTTARKEPDMAEHPLRHLGRRRQRPARPRHRRRAEAPRPPRPRSSGHAAPGADGRRARAATFVAYPTARAVHLDGDANSPVALLAMFGDRDGRATSSPRLDRAPGRPRRRRLPAVRRDGRAARRRARRYVVLEHLYDGYLRGGWLKGPIGSGHAAASGCTRRARWTRAAARAGRPPSPSSTRRRRGPPANVVHTGPVVTGGPARRRTAADRAGQPEHLQRSRAWRTACRPSSTPSPACRRAGRSSPPAPWSTRADLRRRPTPRCTAWCPTPR